VGGGGLRLLVAQLRTSSEVILPVFVTVSRTNLDLAAPSVTRMAEYSNEVYVAPKPKSYRAGTCRKRWVRPGQDRMSMLRAEICG